MEHPQILTKRIGNNVIYQIKHAKFTAEISQIGAHVMSFIPKGEQDLLWMSESAILDGSKAIRGGIPICWPWFGPAPENALDGPQHGYARIVKWLFNIEAFENDKVVLSAIPDGDEHMLSTLQLDLTIRIELSEQITVSLITKNTGKQDFELSQAIHSYFDIGDINSTTLAGLEQQAFVDKLTEQEHIQQDEITITEETDRIYQTQNQTLLLNGSKSTFSISGEGHDSVVVWNPWVDKSKNMADFDDLGYKNMICVEMANTQGLVLTPEQTITLAQTISKK